MAVYAIVTPILHEAAGAALGVVIKWKYFSQGGDGLKKGFKAALAVVLAVCALCIWRWWPRSFADLVSADQSRIVSLACSAATAGLDENANAAIVNYQLQGLERGDEAFAVVLELLNSSQYHQSFLNLLPWKPSRLKSDSGRAVQVFLVWANQETDACYVVFHGDGQVAVSRGADEGLLVYHAADLRLVDRLADYIQTHGAEG